MYLQPYRICQTTLSWTWTLLSDINQIMIFRKQPLPDLKIHCRSEAHSSKMLKIKNIVSIVEFDGMKKLLADKVMGTV